jgi:hypothetical protein
MTMRLLPAVRDCRDAPHGIIAELAAAGVRTRFAWFATGEPAFSGAVGKDAEDVLRSSPLAKTSAVKLRRNRGHVIRSDKDLSTPSRIGDVAR